MRSRRETDKQQTSRLIAEAVHRTTPVDLVAIGTSLVAGDLPTVGTKTRTPLTSDNRVVNSSETSRIGEKSRRNGFHQMCCEK
jgi:hypothetical protein